MDHTASAALLIKRGKVFDHETRTFTVQDVLLENGKVKSLGNLAESHPATSSVDATGKLVLPGLIDFHLHCFLHGQLLGVDVEELAQRSGTTAFVDAGSCGSINFIAFREFVMNPAAAKIFAFLNISALGQHALGIKGIDVTEYDDERFLHLESAKEVIGNNRDRILGVKVRMCSGLHSTLPLQKARLLADETKLPIMVHIAAGTVPLETVLAYLKEGDIVTHPYHGGDDTILDANGKLRPVVLEARKRGILFDVGLDRIHSSFSVIQPALRQGFFPDFISTDLAAVNRHVTIDMPTTISKFIALGLPLEEAIFRSTVQPARKIGKPGVAGMIREGATADIGIFELQEGDFAFSDTYGNSVKASMKLMPVETILEGKRLEKRRQPQQKPSFLAP